MIRITCSRRGEKDATEGSPEGLGFEVRKSGKEPLITFELDETLCARARSEGTDVAYLWLRVPLPLRLDDLVDYMTDGKSLSHLLQNARAYPLCLERAFSHQPTPTLPPKTLAMIHAFLPFSIQRHSPLSPNLRLNSSLAQTNVVPSYETPMSSSCSEQN